MMSWILKFLVWTILYRRDRVDGRRGGRVVLCLNTNILSSRRGDLESDKVEAVVCEICLLNDMKLLIGCFYRPPHLDADYLHGLLDVFDALNNTGISNIFILTKLLPVIIT